jgi:hypothetical protein
MRKTINEGDKPRLRELLALAKQERDKLAAQFAHGDMNETQFKSACNQLAHAVIAQAAINSLEVMK